MTTITLNSSTPKASRNEALAIATKLMQGEQLEHHVIESLYRYFLPATPKKAKTSEQWVAKAVPQKDVRYYLNYLYVKDGLMYGTDGHRIHWAPTDKPNGFYCPQSFNPVELEATYPDVNRVIPEETSLKTYQLKDLDTHSIDAEKPLPVIDIEHLRFRQQYLLDASNGEPCWHLCQLPEAGDFTPIRGKSKFGEYVVMSMRK